MPIVPLPPVTISPSLPALSALHAAKVSHPTFAGFLSEGVVGQLAESLSKSTNAAQRAIKQTTVDSQTTALEVSNAASAIKQGTTILATAIQSYRELMHMQI